MMQFNWRSVYFYVFLIFLLPAAGGYGQEVAHSQELRGQISDGYTGAQLANVTITVLHAGKQFEEKTNSEGKFRFAALPTGRLKVECRLAGYEALLIPDLVLNEGKQLVLDLDLQPVTAAVEGVVIQVPGMEPLSARSISVEETKRFAAVYFDPARVATAIPGVVQADDQSNNLVVRGNSPNGVLWRLEGVDILNPNHLSNAGTLGDRATAGGGGTNILSTQLLGRSVFHTSGFAAEYGNALSGIFDIRLRRGNDEKLELTAQAGLIGLDLAAEGPLGKSRKGSFLVNYRYSTVGLLSILGVPLGDEDIRYQDLSFNLYLPTRKMGTFTLFGMGGLSSNQFFGKERDSLNFNTNSFWKDFFDISFQSNMGAAGMTHQIQVGGRGQLKSALAYSATYNTRNNFYLPLQSTRESDRSLQTRASLSSVLQYGISASLNLKTGIYASQLGYDLEAFRYFTPSAPQIAGWQGSEILLQPFAQLRWSPVRKLALQAGMHGMYYGEFASRALEPRFRATWRISNRQAIHAGVSWHSQLQLPGTYFALEQVPNSIEYRTINRQLDFTRARHYILNFDQYLSDLLRFRIEGYYQDLYNIPIVDAPDRTFSALNLMEGFVTERLVNAGTGRNYGIELNVERLLNRHFYYLFSGTLYRSLYKGGDGVERASRYDGRFATSAAAGYEWQRESKKGRQQIFGLNLRSVYRGGMREMPVDIAASRLTRATEFDESEGFTQQLPNYFRLDLRFTFKRNRAGYTNTLGVDIQNMLNTRNAAYSVYDPAYDRVFLRYQLGIIPLLSYRMEF